MKVVIFGLGGLVEGRNMLTISHNIKEGKKVLASSSHDISKGKNMLTFSHNIREGKKMLTFSSHDISEERSMLTIFS